MISTTEIKIEKILQLHDRGLLTDAEVANEFLLTAANVDNVPNYIKLFDLLPAKLQLAVRSRLNEIQSSGFKWRPFIIGPGLSETDLNHLNNQLRTIYGMLSE